jgi:IclR family pca regulon transcriptional regulator
MQERQADRDFINALAKGLEIIITFSKAKPLLSLSEVAKANQMSLPTARRYLHTLTNLGCVVRDHETLLFQLTPKVLRLGAWILDSMGLRQRLLPFMNSITKQLDITTHCAILEGLEVVTLERLRSQDVVNLDLTAGSRLPLHATSLGKAILAFFPSREQQDILEQMKFPALTEQTITNRQTFESELKFAQQKGYAVADQELTLGLKTLASPVFDAKGMVEASVGVSYPIIRSAEPGLEDLLVKKLLAITEQASGKLPDNWHN